MARRLPLSARVLPGTRRRLRQLALDFAGYGLGSSQPERFHDVTVTHLTGDPDAGRQILEAGFSRFGQSHDSDPKLAWSKALPSERFAEYVHSFAWLHDLHAEGSEASRHLARALTLAWLEDYGAYHSFAWKPFVITERLLAWSICWPSLIESDPASSESAGLRASLQRQARYVSRILDKLPQGRTRLRALVALAAAGLRMRKGDNHISRSTGRLKDEVMDQILPDGGHVSRSPLAAFETYADLRALDDLLEARGRPALPFLTRALDRIVPMIATLSHTDGRLATFHGGGEGPDIALATLHRRDEAKPFAFAPNSGYQRASRGETVLIMDVGDTASFPYDVDAHVSPLAFELSTAAGRMVTSCGFSAEQPLGWRDPVRQLSAHSALDLSPATSAKWFPKDSVFDGSSDIDPAQSHFARTPSSVRGQRREAELGVLLEGSHEGFVPGSGLLHSRRLFLAESGKDIRAEDRLSLAPGGVEDIARQQTVAIRIHLHPDVEAALSEAGTHVDITLGQERWAFLANAPGFEFSVEPSAYLATGTRPVETSQIVITGPSSPPETVIRWGLRRR